MKLQLLLILQGAFMVEQECNQTLFKAKRPVLMSQGPKYFCGKMNSTPFWKRNALVFVFFPNIKKRLGIICPKTESEEYGSIAGLTSQIDLHANKRSLKLFQVMGLYLIKVTLFMNYYENVQIYVSFV